MIGQNGRRGALMITIDIRHPDVEKFVIMKHDLSKVTGANISVKINDDFMRAVENKQPFTLQYPIDSDKPIYTQQVDAESLWNTIVNSATKTAEPGLMMWDNILKELPAQEYASDGFNTVTTNPCGEIPLSPYDSCRLIAVNLSNFVENPYTERACFNFDKFTHCVRVAMRLSDDLVELELEKLDAILNKVDTDDEKELWNKLKTAAENGRRTGLGTLALADSLAKMKLVYASESAIKFTDKIYKSFKIAAYEESVSLAKERGAFKVWSWEKEKNNNFLNRLPSRLLSEMAQYGRRNISLLTNAPTGTCSIAAQTSSGIEPVFRLAYTRRKKLNHDETEKIAVFVDDLGDKWEEFEVYHHAVKEYWQVHGECELEKLPDYFITSDQINWEKRIELQAAIQKHIDHSISSTINLPKGTDPEVVDQLYRLGWKAGLKGVTIYVDGSRTGVLVTKPTQKKESSSIEYRPAPKRPEILSCDFHRANIKGDDWTILVGLMNGKPYEIFGGLSEYVEIPRKYSAGLIRKRPRKTVASKYDLIIGKNGDEFIIKDIVSVFDNPNHTAFTRTISLSMRHGVPVHYLVEQLQKDKDADLFSFSRVIARCLKKYIADGTKASNGSLDCNCESSEQCNVVYQEGCATCLTCGYAKCG
jgi:ribonucleoside-diphosphate reductase alpha chain